MVLIISEMVGYISLDDGIALGGGGGRGGGIKKNYILLKEWVLMIKI